MSEAPERLWAQRTAGDNWREPIATPTRVDHFHQYIRADIHEAKIKELEAQLEWQPIETALDVPKIASGELVIFVWWPHRLQKHASFDSCTRKAQWVPELKEWRIEDVSGSIAPTPSYWRHMFDPPNELWAITPRQNINRT